MIPLRPWMNRGTKATVTLPATADQTHVSVVGDFNDWDRHDLPMKRLKDGCFQASVPLPADERHEFLFLASDGQHLLGDHCDTYANPHRGENSVHHR